MAQRIKNAHASLKFSYLKPRLWQSIYFSVDVGVRIPGGFVHSFAQVIAYVYGLNASNLHSEKPKAEA